MSTPTDAEIEAARLLLSKLGVSAADLLAAAEPRPQAPTFAEYVPVVSAAVSAGTRRVYSSYWNRIVNDWGERQLTGPTPTEIERLSRSIKENAAVRRNARGGRYAAEQTRGAQPHQQLLRYANGKPITKRRYDNLWVRLGKHLPYVHTQQISTHWLRHTTLTWVERNFGYATAKAYAGHTDNASAGTTATYVRATLPEIAAALAVLTGEPHPLTNN